MKRCIQATEGQINLSSAPTYPDPKGDFTVVTDASDTRIGAVLAYIKEGTKRLIGLAIKSITTTD